MYLSKSLFVILIISFFLQLLHYHEGQNWDAAGDYAGYLMQAISITEGEINNFLSFNESIVSQSSGIFTFGATGIYLILAVGAFRNNAGTRATSFNLKGTTNNSTYTNIISAEVDNSDFGGSNNTSYHAGAIPAIFDVTDTAQVKFRFTVQATGDTQTCDGDTDRTYTGFTIVRLGDT